MSKNKFKKHQNVSSVCHPQLIVKKKLNKFFGNVNLYLIDCPYEDFTKYSAKGFPFLPQDLESRPTNEREIAREIVLNFMKHMTEMSDSN